MTNKGFAMADFFVKKSRKPLILLDPIFNGLDIPNTNHESLHLEKSSPSITEPGKTFTFRKLFASQYCARNDATIRDSVGELSTTCCQLVKVASILNQYWTSWQHVVLKPVQTEFANSINPWKS
jgi:hypothetical protein